jgi:hypothetical protein
MIQAFLASSDGFMTSVAEIWTLKVSSFGPKLASVTRPVWRSAEPKRNPVTMDQEKVREAGLLGEWALAKWELAGSGRGPAEGHWNHAHLSSVRILRGILKFCADGIFLVSQRNIP